MKFITQGKVVIERHEDGGQAKICEAFPINTGNSDEENGMFVVLKSWDEDTDHADLQMLLGKKIKITIETID
jgi:hypothetical protein